MKKSIIILCSLLVGCGISEQKYDAAISKCDSLNLVIENLREEIDDLKNGEDRLVNLAKNAYSSKQYILANQYIESLKSKHPESAQLSYLSKLQGEIQPKIQEELAAIEKHRRDSVRLANIDNLGVWEIGYYVDDFGEKTKKAYVSTELLGTFSNSATTNSNLRVRFLIDNQSIRIQLYEYARNHPIKGEGTVIFKARDTNNKEYTIRAWNSDSGDTSVNDGTGNIGALRQLLLEGGALKFIATAGSYSTSEYKFTLENADFLENALLKAGIEFK